MEERERVTTLARLAELALERRCVVVIPKGQPARRHQPAAFVIGMPGRLINRMFEIGMYVYQKEEKTK